MDTKEIFNKGNKVESEYFTGGDAWFSMMVSDANSDFDCKVYNVSFAPKCRNFWHTHPDGQILLVTKGEGFYQEKGKTARFLKQGDVVIIPAKVLHWHGASNDKEFVHLGINPKPSKGAVNWVSEVTDEEYQEALLSK